MNFATLSRNSSAAALSVVRAADKLSHMCAGVFERELHGL
jgi:hypothetical protein